MRILSRKQDEKNYGSELVYGYPPSFAESAYFKAIYVVTHKVYPPYSLVVPFVPNRASGSGYVCDLPAPGSCP